MSRLVRQHVRKFYHQEGQYLNLIKNTLIHGKKKETRNGNTLSLIGESMRFSLKHNKIPLVTTKKLAWKTCLKELLWFINGDTDNEVLQKQNVNIWDGNSSREFLEAVRLQEGHGHVLGEGGMLVGQNTMNFSDVSSEPDKFKRDEDDVSANKLSQAITFLRKKFMMAKNSHLYGLLQIPLLQ